MSNCINCGNVPCTCNVKKGGEMKNSKQKAKDKTGYDINSIQLDPKPKPLTQAEETIYLEGLTTGEKKGRKDGHVSGEKSGYEKGKKEGFADGQTKGYRRGEANGKQSGYKDGKEKGYIQGHYAGSIAVSHKYVAAIEVKLAAHDGYNNVGKWREEKLIPAWWIAVLMTLSDSLLKPKEGRHGDPKETTEITEPADIDEEKEEQTDEDQ